MVRYTDNGEAAYFSDIQLYKEEFGQSYTYDDKGNVVSVKDQSEKNRKFDYDANNNLIGITPPTGGKFTYEYSKDGKNNLTKSTNEMGVESTYDYTKTGRPSKIINKKDELKNSEEISYENNDNFTKSIRNASGYETINIWYFNSGLLKEVNDNTGGKRTYEYNSLNRSNVKLKTKINETKESIKESIYNKDKLSSIIQNGYKYNFSYDDWGNKKLLA
ncbi:RHS repeat domain-containing protein [endosymbiont 'TC1' of Trimyema compressum]|uniref:RHS repeat domain-containing protein n=1 Tax=endosymbiont 'TC1' of Trimyema compressum TaxID=243899 RepID=UPI000B4C5C20|nr:RHS repeat domain-containing protein [endosymbiont 'TC1' of Trimyema compressum]